MKMKLPNLKNFLHEELIEAGCDEAGRGPLAGPVFAAAVILPKDFYHPLLDDSKKMTAAHRDEVRKIIEKEAIAWAMKNAKKDDIILLAGKGHETYQILPTGTIHFDEREAVAEVLEELNI